MSDWKKYKFFCPACGRWNYDVEHLNCSKGQVGSTLLLDINTVEIRCDKCHNSWRLVGNSNICEYCSHVQKAEFVDSIASLEVGDRLLATDGNVLYILRRSGSLLLARRTYPYSGFEQ